MGKELDSYHLDSRWTNDLRSEVESEEEPSALNKRMKEIQDLTEQMNLLWSKLYKLTDAKKATKKREELERWEHDLKTMRTHLQGQLGSLAWPKIETILNQEAEYESFFCGEHIRCGFPW